MYFIVARVGLGVEAVAGFASLVWPATGVALAALVRFGYRLWPGVFIGAVAANAWVGAPALVAFGIGAGNTLEAVAGTYLLRRIPGFCPSLDRLRDVIGLIALAAGIGTMISATIGVSSLYLGGILPLAEVGTALRAWWLGDAIGALVVAPVLLVWTTARGVLPGPRPLLEASALIVSVLATSLLIFGGSGPSDSATFEQAYLVFPPLIWAAIRFGQRAVAAATLLTSIVAVWGTVSGQGPFAQSGVLESLFPLQTFMAVAAATVLLLGASIAERRRAEERLREAHAKVTEADRSKAEFLTVMSHELRTPLNAISGYVDLMLLEAQDPITETQRSYLSRIRNNQRHLLSSIEDVLNFTQVEAGQLPLSMQTVRVCDVLDALEPLVEPELRRKNLCFAYDPCDRSLSVRADPEKLRQILSNLLANAVKFTGPGGRIGIGATCEGGGIRMWISDTGIGIPPDQLERVFEPFFQVDRGLTRTYPGTGLGLAIARDFARAMGGEVRLQSQPEKGSTASLVLPSA
ncbi:MAG TPA: MASE1 domain-containing protein [Gemmatimonadaceae bacterium]|nr:MASE1 domain-containing protein [Gemmatimonadaceae bacterium]